MIDDPLSLLSLSIWLMAAGMWPVGFLFGACSACCDGDEECSNLTCDGFDLEDAYTLIGNCGLANRGPEDGEGYGPFGTNANEFGGCNGLPQNVPEGCADQFCQRRKSCMRWLCRCYESTGEKGVGNPDKSSWYTVVTEEEKNNIGGPTTNDLDLSEELDAATVGGAPLEHVVIDEFGPLFDLVEGPLGSKKCIVWAFTFYGHRCDCETTFTGVPTYHESADDCYTIVPCARCGPNF
jgi:hypothetical protein